MNAPMNTVSVEQWEALKQQYRWRQSRANATRKIVGAIHEGTFGTAETNDVGAQ